MQKLIEAVNSGKVDVKNLEEIVGTASALLDSDMLSLTDSFRSLQRLRSDLESEVRGLERTLDSLREGEDRLGESAADSTSRRRRSARP